MRPLTAKEIVFAHYVADGLTASEAYRRAYSNNGNQTVTKKNAHEVRHRPAVVAFVEELRKETGAVKLAERTMKRRLLVQIMCDRDADPRVRIEAIKIDNLMTGENSAMKVEGEITLGSIVRDINATTGLPSKDAKRR